LVESLLSTNYVNHYIDLLGSGWVQVKYPMDCYGVEGFRYKMNEHIKPDQNGIWFTGRINTANLKESQRIWRLIDPRYAPFDWQLDFKSGYRWQESTWAKHLHYGHKPGVDIKVPWELARMQHLPVLAWAYRLFINNDYDKAQIYLREFRNQVLDFIANNPPRYGVNWLCTMDVGIRIANWLISYDLFRAFGVSFDTEFETVFKRSAYEHGKHCIKSLEYQPRLRSNHYLSDIAGILFAAAYLQRTNETDAWLAFAVQELINEMEFQFNPDGGNFEASTSYHRLSTEIMLYCAILCLSLPEEKRNALKNYRATCLKVTPKLKSYHEQRYDIDKPGLFPDWFWERLEKAAEFTLHITKPTGEVVQFGDNDSGRFLKIWPSYTKRTVKEAVALYYNLKEYDELALGEDYWDENILDHSHIIGVAGVLFQRSDFLAFIKEPNPEMEMVKAWLGSKAVSSYHSANKIVSYAAGQRIGQSGKNLAEILRQLAEEFGTPIKTAFALPKNSSPDGLQIYAYPDFGIYIYQSTGFFLAIRCGSLGQNGNGGHAHNDQLSIELNIDGVDIISDPGTYVYTPSLKLRNRFRSTAVHFTPQYGFKEQNQWWEGKIGLFSLKDQTRSECIYFGKDGFVGRHYGFGKPVTRGILLNNDSLQILDFGCPEIKEGYINQCKISNGYGRLMN
jgi:hypothetical protein